MRNRLHALACFRIHDQCRTGFVPYPRIKLRAPQLPGKGAKSGKGKSAKSDKLPEGEGPQTVSLP